MPMNELNKRNRSALSFYENNNREQQQQQNLLNLSQSKVATQTHAGFTFRLCFSEMKLFVFCFLLLCTKSAFFWFCLFGKDDDHLSLALDRERERKRKFRKRFSTDLSSSVHKYTYLPLLNSMGMQTASTEHATAILLWRNTNFCQTNPKIKSPKKESGRERGKENDI